MSDAASESRCFAALNRCVTVRRYLLLAAASFRGQPMRKRCGYSPALKWSRSYASFFFSVGDLILLIAHTIDGYSLYRRNSMLLDNSPLTWNRNFIPSTVTWENGYVPIAGG